MTYDLEERTQKFGENIIRFCKQAETNLITRPIISQLIRSATSLGANYMEANGASSRKDFRNKIHIAKKEIQEAKHWIRMLNTSLAEPNEELRILWKEANELALIFQKITQTLNKT